MFDSLIKGIKMIFASLKMGCQDPNLMIPSILTVLTNIGFGCLLLSRAGDLSPVAGQAAHHASRYGLPNPLSAGVLTRMGTLNGTFDPSGFNFLSGYVNQKGLLLFVGLIVAWWLTNRFLEGVTSMLVYCHLTEGSSSGKFLSSCGQVFLSLPAIVALGAATFLARRLAGFLQRFRGGLFGLLSSMLAIFWTLAGHLILPAIVIEGTSFIGGLRRADKIAAGNLITIGVGEVGVDGLCRFFSWLTYLAGAGGFGYAMYKAIPLTSPEVLLGAAVWALAVVAVTSLSIYLRAAFYTCLYVWATDSEAVHATERASIRPPSPLAAALA